MKIRKILTVVALAWLSVWWSGTASAQGVAHSLKASAGNMPAALRQAVTRDLAQEIKLVADDGGAGDAFGLAVAIDGDTALIGAPSANVDDKINQGAAYVFVREGQTWTFSQKLLAAAGTHEEAFGVSVALDGNRALIGAEFALGGDNQSQGAAYIFERVSGVWEQRHRISAQDNEISFGAAVALEGDTALVGAPRAGAGDLSNPGAAYVFLRAVILGIPTWLQIAKLSASDGVNGDELGAAVALSGTTALIGARFAGEDFNNRGAAYVFTEDGGWSEQQKLEAPDPTFNARFGNSVALQGDIAMVGALASDDEELGFAQGSVYVFTRSGGVWSVQQKIVADDGESNDNFGASIALQGDTALVGAFRGGSNPNNGAAYVFASEGGVWNQRQKLSANDGAPGDAFGGEPRTLALDGDIALIGAPRTDIDGNSGRGAAYIFTPSGEDELFSDRFEQQ